MAKAVEEVKKPAPYFLVPCRKPGDMSTDELTAIVDMYQNVMVAYSDCFHRHNNLVEIIK